MKQFFCELLFICAVASPGAKPVEELTYGTVLYEYYQQDYSTALLNTLVAQAQNRVGEEQVKFELAKGSFAFAGGMYGYANEIFSAIPEGELEPLDEMRLAFHLGREFHRRQAWPELAEQLAKIDLGKSWLGKQRVHPEVEFMKAELAVVNGQYDEAARLYAEMDEQNPLRAYGLFNLGVVLRANGDNTAAMRTFRRVAKMPAYSEEAYDLSQRARLALALLARQEKNTTRAEQVLADLPGDGRYQDVAMAAYGGLAMDTEDYELAARIWMTLQEEEYWTPSTATARLGFPLSLEKMAATGHQASTELALLHYRQAENSFANRLATLNEMTDQAQDPNWVRNLLEVFSVPEQQAHDDPERQARMQTLMQQWQQQLGHTDWLEWLATDNVHQTLVQWRELNGMQDWLADMPERLTALEQVAVEQLARSDQAEKMLVDEGLLASKQALEQRIHALQADLVVVTNQPATPTLAWMYPLANADERSLLTDLQQKRRLVQRMPAAEQERWLAKVDRLIGVVFFQIVAEQSSRVRALHKQLAQLSELVGESEAQVARVSVAEENFVAGVGTDFQLFVDRAEQISARVSSARLQREEMLAGEIRRRMQDEIRQVEQYLLVTRIAIARATDHLAMAGDQQ